jgi:hypothetical protein
VGWPLRRRPGGRGAKKNITSNPKLYMGKDHRKNPVLHAFWKQIYLYTILAQRKHCILYAQHRDDGQYFIVKNTLLGIRVSSETSFVSKQPKLEPKLVSALSETRRLFRLFQPKQQQIC